MIIATLVPLSSDLTKFIFFISQLLALRDLSRATAHG